DDLVTGVQTCALPISFCGQLLADLGAEVLKIERPGSGDETRTWGPPFAGALSAYFLSCNRNKRGITLDLSRPEGVQLFHELIKQIGRASCRERGKMQW